MPFSFFGRFTPLPSANYTLDDMEDIISDYTDQYVISYEQKPRNNHFHFVMLECVRGMENLRYRLKSVLDGQLYLSGKGVEDKVKAIAYTIKDGNYKSHGIDVFTWMVALRTTRPKESFDEDLKKLIEEYTPIQHTERWLVSRLVDIHIKFNRKIYSQHLKALKDHVILKKDPCYKEKYIDKILAYD